MKKGLQTTEFWQQIFGMVIVAANYQLKWGMEPEVVAFFLGSSAIYTGARTFAKVKSNGGK